MAEKGYIVISDITGYTAYLSGSELEHAEDSLRSLLDLLIHHARPPLVISRLEGDAVISYAAQGSFLQGQTLMEILENTYVAFRQAQERMQLNTTCTCMACRNIPNLDLKFFTHFGSFILQDVGTYKELVGNDVNLAHRLLKNRITEETGQKAYAAYTEAAVEVLGIREFCAEMIPHTETYEHLGEVTLFVQDMHAVWERERKRRRVFVEPKDALFSLEVDIPAPVPLVWDYFTKPEYRMILMGADAMDMGNRTLGRTASGAVYYCAHGDAKIPQTIIDWRPFEYYTVETEGMEGVTGLTTLRFVPNEGGTRVVGICGKAEGPLLKRKMMDRYMKAHGTKDTQRGLEALQQQILDDLNAGLAVRSEPGTVEPAQIEAALAASLAG